MENYIYYSIIIPHYNLGKSISKLLFSIKSEINENYEIIIVDDKSDEEYFNELKNTIRDIDINNIKLFTNTTIKKGAGVCRNIGMRHATGEWYIFSDSDDHFVSGFSSLFLKYVNNKADMVLFPPISTDEYGNLTTRHDTFLTSFKKFQNNGSEIYLRYDLPVVWSRMIRSSLIKKYQIRFDQTMASNDVMFALKVGHFSEEIIVEKNNIYSWNQQSNSITSSMTKDKFNDVIEVMIRRNQFLKSNLLFEDYKKLRKSAIKPLIISLLRYKFGLKHTLKVFYRLLKNDTVLLKKDDLKFSSVTRFFKNNKFYKK